MTVPVTVLTGALGAGKTTLLNHVLTGEHGYEAAVVVNDVGEVNVDAALVERRVEDDREVVELSNGCICCGIRGEFEQSLTNLAFEEEFDHLLVEPSGISEPAPVVEQIVGGHAASFYHIDSVTAVVDARQFYDAFHEGEIERRGPDENGTRPLSDLIVEDVEFCDAVVVNKTDLVDEDELESVIEAVRTVQPGAELLETEFGRVDPDRILDTGRFDAETVSDSASWKRAIDHHHEHGEDDEDHSHDHGEDDHHEDHDHDDHHEDHDHAHPPEVYGIDSFVYERREPMHPGRLLELLGDLPESVVRAKGHLHVAGRPEHALTMSHAGTEIHVEVAGRWIVSLPEEKQGLYRRHHQPDWDEQWGDRKTELVFIGQDVDAGELRERLDDCRLEAADEDAEPDEFDNPFPGREGGELRI